MADLTGGPQMRAVSVTATLSSGFSVGAGWGIALDGLLAAQVWARRKAEMRAAGTPTVRLVDQDDPIDLPLPLARCGSGTDWHWAATCAWPEPVDLEHPRDVRTWTGRVDERICRQLVSTAPGTMPVHHGRWRQWVMPVVVTLCRQVTWRAVADPEALRDLLTPIAAIGKKRSQGEGQVLAWDVQVIQEDPQRAAHLHPDGTLGRPAPARCVPSGVTHGGLGRAGIRPPYTHRARQQDLLRPQLLP